MTRAKATPILPPRTTGRKAIEIKYGEYSAAIGVVKRSFLGFEDHGMFTAYLDMDFGGTGQGVGLHGLSHTPRDSKEPVFTPGLGAYLHGFMRAAGVKAWEELIGKRIVVLYDEGGTWGQPKGIAPCPPLQGAPFIFADWSERVKSEFPG